MRKFLHDLFVPHLHNNFRSRLLHHQSLIISIIFILGASFLLSGLRSSMPQVLGIATDINPTRLLIYTNEKRQQVGVGPLSLNEKLSLAAEKKANNMFSENYWAHNSPSGKNPWVFIKDSGYTYTYAGENLAKGFTEAEDVIKAWMESPTHRENMLSKNYYDVGFAVVEGKLRGEETVLIVEMFGNTTLAKNESKDFANLQENTLVLNSTAANPLIDVSSFSKNASLIFAVLFLSLLLIDILVVERKKVTRFVGHNLDHIFFFSAIILIIIVITRGAIL